ncbi:hypothetical protein LTR86_009070 [Recurvomyces mirabilis]|nr:hypothetical protein LTR86_009070 [Recurvomyces mirabilis]
MDDLPSATLPPEIRLQIYNLVFTSPISITISRPVFRGNILHPLTRVCRQLRTETLELNLSCMRVYKHYKFSGVAFVQWLRNLGPIACSQIGKIGEWSTVKEMRKDMRDVVKSFKSGLDDGKEVKAVVVKEQQEESLASKAARLGVCRTSASLITLQLGMEVIGLVWRYWMVTFVGCPTGECDSVLRYETYELGGEATNSLGRGMRKREARRHDPRSRNELSQKHSILSLKLARHTKVTTTTMEKSPLSRLPPELRNQIYAIVFDKIRTVYIGKPKPFGPYVFHALTRTCRQLRSETLLLSFGELEVRAHRSPRPLISWLTDLGPLRCSLLRKIEGIECPAEMYRHPRAVMRRWNKDMMVVLEVETDHGDAARFKGYSQPKREICDALKGMGFVVRNRRVSVLGTSHSWRTMTFELPESTKDEVEGV